LDGRKKIVQSVKSEVERLTLVFGFRLGVTNGRQDQLFGLFKEGSEAIVGEQ